MKTKWVKIDHRALMQASASPVLALAPHVIGATVAMSDGEPDPSERRGALAVVRVHGPLAQRAVEDLCAYVDGYDAVEARLSLALESDAEAVLLVIDSPGGDVAGLEEAVTRMRAAKDRSGKRVVCYVDELAASAAYWIAAAVADEIVVPPSGQVGSIGAIGAMMDATGALEKEGLRMTLIREPNGKAEAHPYGPVSPLAEERLQALVSAAAGRFYRAVSSARDLPTKEVRALNGALLTGRAAVEAGLADRVGSVDDAAGMAGTKPRKGRGNMKLQATVAAMLKLDAETTEADAAEKLTAYVDGLNKQLEAQRTKASELETAALERDQLRAELEQNKRARLVDIAIKVAVDQRKLRPAKVEEFRAKAMQHGVEWAQSVIDELPVLLPEAPAALVSTTAPGAPAPQTEANAGINKRTAARALKAGADLNKVAELKAQMLRTGSDGDDQ